MKKPLVILIIACLAVAGLNAQELVVNHSSSGFIETEITIALNMAGKVVNDITTLKITGSAELNTQDCVTIKNTFGATLETLDLSEAKFQDNKIPSSATTDDAAFYNMSITSVILPSTLIEVGDRAFHSCGNLTTVNLPEGLETIGTYSFHKNFVLAIDKLPESLKTLRNYAFESAYLVSFSDLPKGLTFIGAGAFRHCRSTTISQIPDGITSLAGETFRGCTSMTKMIFHVNFASMGNNVFQGNTALSSLYFHSFFPPTVGTTPFSNIDATTITVYVPIGAKTAYSNNAPWNTMKEIIEYDPASSVTSVEAKQATIFPNPTTGKFTIESENPIEKIDILDVCGKSIGVFTGHQSFNIENLENGVYYVRTDNGRISKIIKK